MAKVFEGFYSKGTLLETFGLVATNNGTTKFARTEYGHALRLNGSSQWISYAGSVSVKSVIIFLKPNALSSDIIDFDGGTHSIEVGAANVTATGFATPSITVNTAASAALSIGRWQMIAVTSATAFTANAIKIGKETSYFNGDIAYVMFDSAQLTAQDLTNEYAKCLALRLITKPQRGFYLPKPTDLSRFKGSGAGRGLVAAYNMRPNGRTLTDISGNGNNGSLVGGVYNTLDGLGFNGTTGYISVPNSASLNFGTGDFTIEWFGKLGNYVSSGSAWNCILAKGVGISTGGSFGIYIASNSQVIFAVNGQLTTGFAYANGGNYHIFCKRYGQLIEIDINGIFYDDTTHPDCASTVTNVGDLLIGNDSSNVRWAKGMQTYYCNFLSRQLSLSEIRTRWNTLARTKYAIFDFSQDAVGSTLPLGWTLISGSTKISELSAPVTGFKELVRGKKYLECVTAAVLKTSIPSNSFLKNYLHYSSGWIRESENFLTDISNLELSVSGNKMTLSLSAGEYVSDIVLQSGREQYQIDTLSQGLQYYDNGSNYTYTRLGSIAAEALNASPGNAKLPVQSKMKGCVLRDNGTVNYYLGATDWSFREDMVTASVLTGADGQVMVEIPKFYTKYEKEGIYTRQYISLYPLDGFIIHPAFIKDGVEVNFRYIGAYEAVLWDATTSTYIDYAAGATITPAEDKLSSISGLLPVANFTRASGRSMAARRGTGWRQQDYDLCNAIEWLILIEYGTFYIQNIAEVGPGITNVGDWAAYNNYYPFNRTGSGNGIGNASGDNAGGATCVADTAKYSKYRGISNFYGHVWKFVDGININANHPYVTNNSAVWADNTATGYTDPGITLAAADGYQKTLAPSSRLMLPASVGGGSTTYTTDYYYQAAGWRIAILGGVASHGATAGPWFWGLTNDSGASNQYIGSRVAF